nr:putative ribonuclease H-like domain-containing protein [Tanacetum cinerariifolium]
MALPDKHQLKFNSHKDAKTLIKAIEKRFGRNTETKKVQKTLLKQQFKNFTGSSSEGLDQIHDRLQKLVSQLEIHGVSLSQEDVNLKRFLQKTGKNLGANGPTSMGFDMTKVECYNCNGNGHFARKCRSPKDPRRSSAAEPQRRTVLVETSTSNALVSQYDGTGSYDWSYQAEKEPTNFALMAFSSSSSDNELSPTKPVQALSHTTRPSAPIIEDWLSDSETESEPKAPQFVPSFAQSFEHVKSPKHTVQQFETTILAATPASAIPKSNSSGQRRNRKACFVCKSVDYLIKDCNFHTKKMAQPTQRNYAHKGHNKQYAPLTHSKPQKHMVLTAVLTRSKPISNTVVRPVSAALPNIIVTRPRHAHHVVTKFKSPIRRHTTRRPSLKTSNSPLRVIAVQAPVVSVAQGAQETWGNPQQALKDKGVINSRCSRHMTGNMSYLSDFEEINGGYVAFGGNPKGGKITGKGKIKTGKLDFDDVYFVKELKFNLFSVSQMCDKKNSVLFIDTECLVLSPDFKLLDESQVLLRVPRENNMYNVNLKNIVPSGDLTCLFAKATIDESNLWHRRLAHINFKTTNKLVKGNLVSGLPTKVFKNDHSYVACKKGKQHKAFYKTKPVSSIDQPLFRLHMDLFGPTFVKSLNKKSYCLVIIDDYSRFTWVFFLATKDDTSLILKTFITGLENQLSLKVKNRVLVTKPHNQTLYELLHGRTPSIGFMRPFGCLVTILNTIDPLGKFQGKVDEGFLVEYFSAGSTNPQNNDEDAAFDGKEHDFDATKTESIIILSLSSSAQSRKQDDKTKKEDKGKSHVESFIGYRDLNAEFEDCSDNSSNEVNAVGFIVPTVGQNTLNSTNTFSDAGPSNTTVSPTYGKYLSIDASQLPDDPDMPKLEDITYSDDEDVEEPKRVHQALKDPSWIEVMQEELFQFKMQKVWVLVDLPYGKRAIGFEDPDHPDKVNKVVKALYGLHQAPRAWYETLATYLLENDFQRGTIDQTLFIKKQKRDILLV